MVHTPVGVCYRTAGSREVREASDCRGDGPCLDPNPVPHSPTSMGSLTYRDHQDDDKNTGARLG